MQNNETPQTIFINRYRLERELSHNAGRKTFLALDFHSQDLVIIKILQFDNLFRWDDLKLFEREAQTLQNIDHPAIPKYLDYFEVEENGIHGFALVQTYIDAPSLETNFKSGCRFSEAELIELATKLLDILTYLHSQIPPVIHRDLKPSNILIANRSAHSVGNIYLVDFGSVQTVASKDNGTITIVGTYGYIPLEQFSGKTTTASDLYSLGMTLIYLTTGVHPAELNQVEGKVQFSNGELSRQFTKWLEKMTYPYPEKRFESAESAKNALNSKDGISGDYLHLRPANSKVKVYRDPNKLEIVYPYSYKPKEKGWLVGCWINSILFIALLSALGPGFIGFALLSLLIKTLVVISKNRYSSQDIIEGKIIISLGYIQKKQNLKLKHTGAYLIGENIYMVSYGAYDPSSDARKTLLIHTSTYRFLLTYNQLSSVELRWLGQEICDFLGLELQVMVGKPGENENQINI